MWEQTMIKLCIFDLDGTVVDSLRSIAHFANETLVKFDLEPFPVDDYRYLAGGGARKLMTNLINARNADINLLENMVSDWLGRYEKKPFYLTEPYDGINEMLENLKSIGIITAIVTNKSKRVASSIIEHAFGIPGKLIDEAVSEHPGMVLKPAPDEILKLCEKYSVLPRDTMYVGDHGIDMETGKNAHVTTCGVTWGFHSEDELISAGADFIAHQPNNIIEYINKTYKENCR
jgi:phosphoglycolate phosphatase